MNDIPGRGLGESRQSEFLVGLNAVVLAVTGRQPRVLTVSPQASEVGKLAASHSSPVTVHSLPSGSFDGENDRTLELCLRRSVVEQTNNELGYVEQLYTFADQGRDHRAKSRSGRVLSVGYLALAQESSLTAAKYSSWENCFDYLPWEDWRNGRPDIMDEIASELHQWAKGRKDLLERVEICFGSGDAGWDAYKVLERYELLYEAKMVSEFWLDRGQSVEHLMCQRLGHPMAFDHRRILATGLGRVRGKLRYRPLIFEMIPETFTLLHLQQVAEALTGLRLKKQNFRRQVEQSGLVEGTGKLEQKTGGRPAELFRFRRAVLRERRAPGMTTLRWSRDA
ncbi:MAG: hypothetical protein VX690_03600 [Pseudomonadota bacterium]|nr:hypothetical protein [Pseudomonadota bacterium]